MEEAAIPAVNASGDRRRLRTRTGYTKIGSDRVEVSSCVRQRALHLRLWRASGKPRLRFGLEDRDEVKMESDSSSEARTADHR